MVSFHKFCIYLGSINSKPVGQFLEGSVCFTPLSYA